jgi:hypothetical protein
MADLDDKTLFGEECDAELVPWPHGFGNRPQRIERTLFGEISLWRVFRWPEGHGSP